MSKTDTGGPAFPLHSEIRPSIDTEWCGMTLRDYFAAKAMQAILSDPNYMETDDKLANASYSVASAMLKAREQ